MASLSALLSGAGVAVFDRQGRLFSGPPIFARFPSARTSFANLGAKPKDRLGANRLLYPANRGDFRSFVELQSTLKRSRPFPSRRYKRTVRKRR